MYSSIIMVLFYDTDNLQCTSNVTNHNVPLMLMDIKYERSLTNKIVFKPRLYLPKIREVFAGTSCVESKSLEFRSGNEDCVHMHHVLYIQCLYRRSAGCPVLRYYCTVTKSSQFINYLSGRVSPPTVNTKCVNSRTS